MALGLSVLSCRLFDEEENGEIKVYVKNETGATLNGFTVVHVDKYGVDIKEDVFGDLLSNQTMFFLTNYREVYFRMESTSDILFSKNYAVTDGQTIVLNSNTKWESIKNRAKKPDIIIMEQNTN
jgi:hypothetical protein